ncbi:MAG: hypothetical protein JXR37_15365 [Kiritimatiellae bacterium]|nr:hypothetical protein [Kiritimatiellia bacterium]
MKQIGALLAAAAMLVSWAQDGTAASSSFGFRAAVASWRESDLYGGSESENGTMFGPTFLFRLGDDENVAVGVDGLYGQMGALDRADAEVMLFYYVAPLFGVFADFRYMWGDYDASADPDIGEKVTTTVAGFGGGVTVDAPLGDSPLFVFANTRFVPVRVSTDVEDASGAGFLWAYEAGLAYAAEVATGAGDSCIYAAGGYRYHQMKGSDFDETMSMPFVEAGFKQEF